MKGKYPMLCNWVKLETNSPNETVIKNRVTDEEFVTDQGERFISFLRKLDGKNNPYEIDSQYSRKEVMAILNQLKEYGLLRESRVLDKQKGSIKYALFFFHQMEGRQHRVATNMHCLLYLFCIPVFIVGIVLMYQCLPDIESVSVLGLIIGAFIGVIGHELGHCLGTIAYGGTVYEVGVSCDFIFPGFYILSTKAECSRLKSAQISAAGIEANLLISGIFLILTAMDTTVTDLFFSASITNLTLGMINLLFINGLDGSEIISDLFGFESNIVPIAIQSIKSKSIRRKLKNGGVKEQLLYMAFCFITILQIAVPIMILLDIVGVISWFL